MKRLLEQEEAQGFCFREEAYVCARCIEDTALRAVLRADFTSDICSYCGWWSNRPIAAPLETLLGAVVEGLETEWMDPGNILGWDSAEGGWLGTVYDTYDLIRDALGEDLFQNESLTAAVIEALGDRQWCSTDYARTDEGDRLRFGWNNFCELVKHKTRYMFFDVSGGRAFEGDDDVVDPTEMLKAIGLTAKNAGLVRAFPKGTKWFRARPHSRAERFDTARDLGSPPRERTQTNRMSPHGIPMFYGAAEKDTAFGETVDQGETQAASWGLFEQLHELLLLDLVKLPAVPSLFDRARRERRSPLRFVHGFVRDVAKPIKRDGEQHTEYVPTQIVTEYFRHSFTSRRQRLHGIVYPSSLRERGTNVVLFCENSASREQGQRAGDGWLRLIEAGTELLGGHVAEAGNPLGAS